MDIIIGAGVSGLSYARFTKDGEYLIIERDSEIGGYCKTTKRTGFVWDYSGHFFHFQSPDLMHLIMDSLIDDGEVVEVEKKTTIRYKDIQVDYPFQKNIHQLPKEEFIDCLVDLFESGGDSYSTFKEMLYCKFGKSISDKFLIPYNEKLYSCDLNLLDKNAMGRFFPYAEKEQIIKNFRKSDNITYNGSFIYPKGGAIEYIKSLSAPIPCDRIECSTTVKKIITDLHTVVLDDGRCLKYDRLISTIPFPKLLDLADIRYDKSIYSWNKVLVFNIGFDSKGPNDDTHWIYFPDNKYCFYRVGFYDVILNQNRTSIYVEIGFGKDNIIEPHLWFPRVLNDLIASGCISPKQKVLDYESIIMDPGYVHITQDSVDDVNKKKDMLSTMDIYSIGRYGSWTYCSIEDNIKEAMDLSSQIINK